MYVNFMKLVFVKKASVFDYGKPLYCNQVRLGWLTSRGKASPHLKKHSKDHCYKTFFRYIHKASVFRPNKQFNPSPILNLVN